MKRPKRALRATLVSVTAIVLASSVLLLLRKMYQVERLGALELSLLLGGASWMTLFVRRCGQGQLALGVYLLVMGGATLILPPLLVPFYGQADPDLLLFFLGPIYALAGAVLVVVSLIAHRHWAEGGKATLVRTALLAGPAIFLTLFWSVIFGPRMWDVPPYGFDLAAFSWIMGAGIFLAGRGFVKESERSLS